MKFCCEEKKEKRYRVEEALRESGSQEQDSACITFAYYTRCITQKNGAVFWRHILLGIPFPQTLGAVPEGTFAGVSIHSRMASRV